MVKKSIKFPSMGPKNNPHRHYGLPLFFRPRPASSSLIECGRADSQEEQVVVEEILTVDPPRPRPNNDSLDCETIHPSLDSDSRHTCPQPLSLLEEFHSDSSSTLILQQSFLTDSDNDMDMDMDKNNDENQSSPGLPFHGLPPEMVQYIARFFSFRTLVLVYKSFPGVHRPILQQMLDHSLALMILTLEIRQFQDVEYLVPVHHNRDRATQNHNNNNNNNNNNNTIAPPLPGAYTISAQAQASMEEETTTTLSTQWRATEFDLDQWTVKFQLEEKLGLEVEAKRRQLLRLQQQQQPQQRENQNLGQIQLKEMNNDSGTSSSSSTTNNSNRNINHNRNSDIASDVAVAVTEDDIENLIWQARSRYSSGRVSPESPTLLAMGTEITPETGVPTGAHSIVTTAAIAATSNNMEESNTATTETASSTTTPFLSVLHDQFDNNFFHCNGSAYPPILSSAKISFKALRNTPAPWISQRIEHLGPHHHYQHPEVSIPTMTFNSSTNDGKDSTYCQLVHNTENNNNSMTAVRSNQAIERIASYQQNQMLQRSLAKMVEYNNHNRNHNQSSGIHQFLHTQVELETGDLGQRLVKSFLLPPTPDSTPGYRGPKQDATTLVSTSSPSSSLSPSLSSSSKFLSRSTPSLLSTQSGTCHATASIACGHGSCNQTHEPTTENVRRHSWPAMGSNNNNSSGNNVTTTRQSRSTERQHMSSSPSSLATTIKKIFRASSSSPSSSPSPSSSSSLPLVSSSSSPWDNATYPSQSRVQEQEQQKQQQHQSMHCTCPSYYRSKISNNNNRNSNTYNKSAFWTSILQRKSTGSSASSFSCSSSSSSSSLSSMGCVVHNAKKRRTVEVTSTVGNDNSTTPIGFLSVGGGAAGGRGGGCGKARLETTIMSTTTTAPSGVKRKRSLPSLLLFGQRNEKNKNEMLASSLSSCSSGGSSSSPVANAQMSLFEFQYSVRHNYMQTSRLEGERVIRPMLFSCSLDFFIDE